MNYNQKYNINKQEVINTNLRSYFELGTKINTLKVNRNASLEHEIKLLEIATKLRYEGRDLVIGGVLKNGQVPDLCVIDLNNPIIYEIGHSESELRNTKETYPFPVTFIKTKEPKEKDK